MSGFPTGTLLNYFADTLSCALITKNHTERQQTGMMKNFDETHCWQNHSAPALCSAHNYTSSPQTPAPGCCQRKQESKQLRAHRC